MPKSVFVKIVSVSSVMTVNTIISHGIITEIEGELDYLNIYKLKYTCAQFSVFLGLTTLTSEVLLRSSPSLVLCVLLCSVDAVGFYCSLLIAHPILRQCT